MKSIAKENEEITMTLKELSREIVKILQGGQNYDMQWIELRIRECAGKESPLIQRELLNFIETYVNRRDFSAEDMHARIDKHCRVFAKYKYHEIRARAKVLLASHYHQTHKYIPECLNALTEAELIVQKHLGTDNLIQCEALFVKGGVYYSLGEIEKSTEALLASQSLKGFINASHAHQYKSHINVSRNFIYLNDSKSAKKHLELAERSWEHYGVVYDKGGLYMRKSDMLRSSNDWNGSLEVLVEGLDFYKQTTFPLRIAEFYKELGEFYWREGNPLKSFEMSMEYFDQALNMSRDLKIPRLESAILNSMWKACRAFERWKECAEYSIMHNKAEAYAHEVEMDIYIKKIEQTALEEKQRLMKQGKPTFSKTLIDEVVQLREENESGRQKLFVLQQKMIDIQKLIENGMNSGGRNGNYLEYLHQMITQVVGDIPTLHQSLLECDKLHPHFSGELMKITPTISGMEMKVAKLIRLGLSTQSIALTCGVTIKSIENHRMKLRKKIMLKQGQSLSAFLTSL